MHHCMCSILYCAQRNASLHSRRNTSSHVPRLTYAWRIASLHVLDIACARRNASLHVLDIACARKNPLLNVLDTACARRNASLHVLDTACARRNASSHCARSLHKPKIALCSNFTCARIKSSHKYQQMSKTDTLSLLLTYIPKASSFMACAHFHGLKIYFMHIMFLRRHSLKASSSWPADIISWPKDLISVYHDPKVS